jgi:hypothetical protein
MHQKRVQHPIPSVAFRRLCEYAFFNGRDSSSLCMRWRGLAQENRFKLIERDLTDSILQAEKENIMLLLRHNADVNLKTNKTKQNSGFLACKHYDFLSTYFAYPVLKLKWHEPEEEMISRTFLMATPLLQTCHR